MGAWDGWYRGLDEPAAYGDVTTYHLAEEHLRGLDTEDWGCGKGYFGSIHEGVTRGIDGSHTPYADVITDLADYRSRTPGLLLRHVLEHNYQWGEILRNAAASVTERMVLVLFTPTTTKRTAQVITTHDVGGQQIPDLSLPHAAIMRVLPGTVTWSDVDTGSMYGRERVYRVTV